MSKVFAPRWDQPELDKRDCNITEIVAVSVAAVERTKGGGGGGVERSTFQGEVEQQSALCTDDRTSLSKSLESQQVATALVARSRLHEPSDHCGISVCRHSSVHSAGSGSCCNCIALAVQRSC